MTKNNDNNKKTAVVPTIKRPTIKRLAIKRLTIKRLTIKRLTIKRLTIKRLTANRRTTWINGGVGMAAYGEAAKRITRQ
ncbi:hypothetical protein GCM10020331_012290 [Ectobacillus funiculus]